VYNKDGTTEELGNFLDKITFIEDSILSFINSLQIGFYAGVCLALLYSISSFIFILDDFKTKIIKGRRGIWEINMKQFSS
jgi:hypothetical protein